MYFDVNSEITFTNLKKHGNKRCVDHLNVKGVLI